MRCPGPSSWPPSLLESVLGFRLFLLLLCCSSCSAQIPRAAQSYRADLMREAQFEFGTSAPYALLGAAVDHESSWRANVIAWDLGAGLGQIQPGTQKWLSDEFPDLGAPVPLSPVWSLRAMVRLDRYNYDRLSAIDECNRWGMVLHAYNSGRGYTDQKVHKSPHPLLWWGVTENEPTTQSPANAKESVEYACIIAYQIQPRYATWGNTLCLPH